MIDVKLMPSYMTCHDNADNKIYELQDHSCVKGCCHVQGCCGVKGCSC